LTIFFFLLLLFESLTITKLEDRYINSKHHLEIFAFKILPYNCLQLQIRDGWPEPW